MRGWIRPQGARLAAPQLPRGRGRLRVVVIALAAALTVIGLAPAASAAYNPEPVGPGWVPDGGVHAVVTDGSTVYVGGAFTGGVAALDALSGSLKWLGNANGDVRALALTGSRLLLGGAFTTVGGTTHRKLAAVNAATGAVDNAFKPAPGGTVRDVVVVNGIAYFGGQFTNLGAVDATTGTAVPGFTFSTNGQVYALGTDGTRLYIGGKFTAVNGLTRNTLASVTLATNTLDSWAPAAGCAITNCNVIWDLTVDVPRHRVYTVGRNPGTLYTVDTATAGVVFRAPGAFNGDSQAVTLAPDGHVYVGGHYVRVTIRGVVYDRMLVSEWDVSGTTPVIQPFSTRFVTSYPGVWAMASTNARLYVGGDFTQAGAQKRFPYFAMFPSGTPDTAPPTVTATSPANNATGVVSPTDVTATFNEPVQAVDNTTFTLRAGTTAVPATVTYANNVATLHPTNPLAGSTQYTATLTGGATAIRDLANNPLGTMSWTFTTAAVADTTPPTVTATSPTSGATGVAPSSDVTATFSEPVQGVDGTSFTLTDGTTAVSATVTSDSPTVARLHPSSSLADGTTYTATLTGGTTAIRDLANNPLGLTSWTFTTANPADNTPPTVTNTIPKSNATGVSRTNNITAAFSETVTNVNTTTFTLRPTSGGANVSATVTFNSTGGRWVLNPAATLSPTTSYTATITNGVTDLAGNAFAGITWSFTTGA
jgi:hypothetical protein